MFLGKPLNYKCTSKRFINKRNLLGSGNVLPNFSNRIRKINTIRNVRGGRVEFGILNRPIVLNSYGRIEGSPGGYGSSPKNKF